MNDEFGIKRRGIRRKRKRFFSFFIIAGMVLFGGVFFFNTSKTERWNTYPQKTVTVIDGGLEFSFSDVTEQTLGEFLEAKKLSLREGDSVIPNSETDLFSGTHILLSRAHTVIVAIDGTEHVLRTQKTTVGEALEESTLVIDDDDIVKPGREAFSESGMRVVVTKVEISEEMVEKPIVFDKKTNEDDTLSWRKSIVTQKGENGIQKLTYRVSRHDGKEVNRKLLNTEVIKEPIPQITTQGTFVKLGKSHTGGASWYAWTGTMAAANPWLPKGSYVKVTNIENGKSVIVVINDRGPFVPGRIIDLDKVAFQKIASVGAGVINVKMEEIIN